jgi:type IV secretory pathway TrbD component
MNGPRKIVIHQSLIRPILIGGAERGFALVNGVVAAALIFGIGSLLAAAYGVLQTLGVHWALVRVAKKDPQFFAVYKRHVQYQIYYPAKAHFSAPPPFIKP